MEKIERNPPCSCGSGKKSKQCCLKNDETLAASKRAETASIPKVIQLALEHHQAGWLHQAEATYQQILQVDPNHPDALHFLGVIAHQTGRNDLAVELIGKALSFKPGIVEAHNNIGLALHELGRLGEAVEHYDIALSIKPDYADAYYNLGNALKGQSKLEEATDNYRMALSLKPNYADAHYNLGNALNDQGKHGEAVEHYFKALALKPDYAKVYNNLGLVLQKLGKLGEAIKYGFKALSIEPDFAEAHSNLGNAFNEQGQLDEAIRHCRRALMLKPDYVEAYINLGNALKDQGKLDKAIGHYRKALSVKPDHAGAHSNLLYALIFHPDLSREEVYREALEYEVQRGMPLRSTWQAHSNDKNPERRLRIGYVSPDFRRHAVALFAEPILANHDKSQVETFCYAEVLREDEYTERFRKVADHWHSTVGLSDEAVAQMIREHRIDILVDLAGHTAKNRLLVFARKPAPIQITYLGYPGTTGLSAMDYRITDRYADPEGIADAYYAERLLRLPGSLCCYRPGTNMPVPSVLPALARGYLTFGSFNNFNKVDHLTMDLWGALLRALPTSRLMMLTVPEGETRQRLVNRFAALGIAAERLEFHGKLPAAEFYRKFLEVDLTLDPVTVGGGTTTCESLWMGVPVIAMAGERFITRVSYSFLSTAGLSDFAAFSAKDYIRLAVHLADNLPLLADIRAGLRDLVAASPLIDEVGFTRNLENLYRDVWTKWCDGETK